MTLKKIIIVLIIGWIIFSQVTKSRIKYDGDSIVKKLPVQSSAHEPPFEHKGFTITPVADFKIEAMILSKKKYSLDKESKLSSFDFALGWGPMSDYNVLNELRITQSGRWYRYRYEMPPPIPKSEIISHSGNMHLIPADRRVAKGIKKARNGAIVRLDGYLVNVKADKDWTWNSSLSREDSGAHSCEVIWVKNIEVKDKGGSWQ